VADLSDRLFLWEERQTLQGLSLVATSIGMAEIALTSSWNNGWNSALENRQRFSTTVE
jgi:hypothetical protein